MFRAFKPLRDFFAGQPERPEILPPPAEDPQRAANEAFLEQLKKQLDETPVEELYVGETASQVDAFRERGFVAKGPEPTPEQFRYAGPGVPTCPHCGGEIPGMVGNLQWVRLPQTTKAN